MASAGQIKGITIKIEGDTSDLAKSLQKVNSDINKTSAALKDVEKALELDPTNTELLATRQELLNKQIEQTAEKLTLEQQAAEDAKQALEIGDITAEEYATLQAEVAKTGASLDELQTSAAGSSDEIEGTGAAAADAGAEAEKSGAQFENWGAVVEGAATVAAGAVTAVGAAVGAMAAAAVEGGKALVEAAGDVATYGDEVDKNSQRVGMSAEAYQRWDYIMKINGSSIDSNIQGFKTLTNALDDARNGSDKALDKFEAVGLSLNDIKDASREDVFEMVIKGLQNMTDETERAAAANDLLGRSSMNLAPLLNGTNEELDQLSQQAEEYGVIMGDDLVADSAAYQDSLTLMDSALTGLKNRLVGEFLPGLTQVTTGIAGMAAGVDGSDEQIQAGVDEIINTFNTMAPAILEVIDTLLPSLLELGGAILSTVATGIISNLDTILGSVMEIVQTLASGLLTEDNLTLILDAAVNILMTLVTGLIDAIDLLIEPAVNAVLTLVDAILQPDCIEKLTDAAIHIILSLVNGLTDAIPQLIPTAISAIETIASGLLENIDKIILAAGDLIMAIIAGCWEATPKLAAFIITNIVPEILKAFGRLAMELPKKAGEWGADLIEGLVNGIKSAMSTLTKAVKNVASTIASYLHFSVPDVGPLADFNYSGGDMIQSFIDSMNAAQPELKAALYQTAGVIDAGMQATPDYTGQLNAITGALGGISNGAGTYVINVMVGTTTLAQAVLSAQQMELLRTGG